MTAFQLPAALHSLWAMFVLINHARRSYGVDVERRWAGDLLAGGMTSDAVVALAILRDEEWQETASLVEAVLRELKIDPADTPMLLRLIRSQIALAIENGADPRDQALSRFVAPTFAIGVRLEADDAITVAAPFGLEDVFSMTIRPNPLRPLAKGWAKTIANARGRWRELTVVEPL